VASSLLTLLDDITTVLDDVAAMTKVAAKKTAGVLGDDLALNAEQVTGVATDRELPVVWAVAKGSAVNKLILVPLALLISATVPSLIMPLLMLGGAFLCFEGFEKVAHKLLHGPAEVEAEQRAHVAAVADPTVDLVAVERDKIKGAIRTDLILSGEIVVISLGTVADKPFVTQVGALIGISVLMTVGVYGLVAGIVKLDDAGLALSKRSSSAAQGLGRGLLWVAPWLMKGLSIAGTAAMFLVGGGIVVHGIPALHHFAESLGGLLGTLVNAATGIVTGGIIVAVVTVVQKLRKRGASGSSSPS
jgi:hypothetical protein